MILNFFNAVANLKTVPRQGWIEKLNIQNPESVSDHTYSLTMMSLVLSQIKKLDTYKILKMSLIHDLAESCTGDITPDQMAKNKKIELETKAIHKILQELPIDINNDLFNIWQEFLERKTPESILVHELDKLEMAIQAKIYEKNTNGDIQPFLNSVEKELITPEIKELFSKITSE